MAKTLEKESFEHIDLMNIPLGHLVKDRISGFEGIAISKILFYNGCIQYQLKPRLDKDKKIVTAELFDCQQLIVIGQGIAPNNIEVKKPVGGDMPDTPKLM